MTDAKRDANQVTTLLAVSNADGVTPVTLWADPVTHRLLVDVTGSSGFATTALDNLASVAINAALVLGTSDAFALGSATKMWSDLFLASGAVINFNNGDVTITHSANALAFAGGTVSFDVAPTVGGSAVYYAGGTDVAVTDGGTGLSAISALSILVANSANTYVELTPGAGNSIRMNAGGTAWEAYTPGSSGASTALDNLASVAINAALVLGTSDAFALGSATKMWSDLFLASGAVVNFNNGDVTLTHSAGVLTLAGTLALGTNSITMTGSIGATGARATKLWATDVESTNAPTVSGAAVYYTGGTDVAVADGGTGLSAITALSIWVANSANTITEVTPGAGNSIRINAGGTAWEAFTPGTSGATTALDNLASVAINAALVLGTSDAFALGSATKMWSDLFLASGAVINFNNGNVTLTHSAGILTLGGTATLALGTNSITLTGSIGATGARATKVWTADLEVTNDITINGTALATTYLAKAGGTLTGNIQLGENTSIDLDPAGSADGKYSGVCITGTAGAALAFGDLIYLAAADSRWELADADAATTADRMLGMCVLAAGADGNATKVLLMGQIRADANFPALTIGSAVYVGETAGAIQVAIPTGADAVIRRVGYALTADEIYFNPSMDSQTVVA